MTVSEIIRMIVESVLGIVIPGALGYIGYHVKEYIDDKTSYSKAERAAKNVARYVEQIYKDLPSEEKAQKFDETLCEMLLEKGITITDLEVKVLREAAVNALNASDWAPMAQYDESKENIDPEEILENE